MKKILFDFQVPQFAQELEITANPDRLLILQDLCRKCLAWKDFIL